MTRAALLCVWLGLACGGGAKPQQGACRETPSETDADAISNRGCASGFDCTMDCLCESGPTQVAFCSGNTCVDPRTDCSGWCCLQLCSGDPDCVNTCFGPTEVSDWTGEYCFYGHAF